MVMVCRTTTMNLSSPHPRIWKCNSRQKLQNVRTVFRINHQLSNDISWRPDPGASTVDAFSINWPLTYNYCFPPFCIIQKVLQKIRQDKTEAIVVIPYRTTQNWFLVLLGMLVDHSLIMTVSLSILYLSTYPTTPHPLHPKLKLLVAPILGGNKPTISYQIWPQFWNLMKKAVNKALLL